MPFCNKNVQVQNTSPISLMSRILSLSQHFKPAEKRNETKQKYTSINSKHYWKNPKTVNCLRSKKNESNFRGFALGPPRWVDVFASKTSRPGQRPQCLGHAKRCVAKRFNKRKTSLVLLSLGDPWVCNMFFFQGFLGFCQLLVILVAALASKREPQPRTTV